MGKNKELKINLGEEKFEAMFESEVKPSGNGAVINAYKKYTGKKVIVLVKKEYDLVGKDGSFDKMELD